jgi:hypothetical protein
MKKKFRNTGLPSLHESRAERHRQIVTGRAKVGGGIPPKLFAWGLAVLLGGGFLYFRSAQAELEEQRAGILLKQRATAKLLEPKLNPLRDQVEGFAKQLATDAPDEVDPHHDWTKLLASSGVYLRARLDDARTVESLRKVAKETLRDGFTSCAFVDNRAKLPTSGKACRESTECESGQYCNEFSACQLPSSPFNMRMLYRALSVLSPAWVKELEDTNSDYKLLALERTLEGVTQVDIPIAIEIHQRAKFAAIVLDEDPKDGVPKRIPNTFETELERVQRVPHFARVGIWDLKESRLLARFRGEAEGTLRSAGTAVAAGGPESEAARARQANSCSLALQFKQKVLQQVP